MGKRSWLEKDLGDRWLPVLAKLEDNAGGRRQAANLCKTIRSGWAEKGFKQLNQQQSLMDQVRVAIRQNLGDDHFSLEYVKFSTDEYTELNNQKQDSVANRNEAIAFIDNPDAIVAKAIELLESPEWSEVCAGLAVLTGRRSSELLSTANFEKASKWSVTFRGALKRRGESQELSFEIPTLTTADRVVKALAKVRSQLPDAMELSAESVNRKYGQAVIRACDQHFAGLVPLREGKDNLYTHLFRAVYATIATFWYCPPTVNDVEFKAAIQGHYAILDENDPTLRRKLTASRHYSDYEIADSVIAQYGGKRKGIKLGHGGVKPIQAFARGVRDGEDVSPDNSDPIQSRQKRKVVSVRIWRDDRQLLDEIFDRLGLDREGTQPERVSAVLQWTYEQLVKLPQALKEEEQGEIEETQVEEADFEGEAAGEEEGEGEADVTLIQSEPIQSTEESRSEQVQPISPLETKIDSLVSAIAQLVQLQSQALSAPVSISPVQTTRRKATTPKPTPAEGEGQAEQKYRPRGENQELVNQAINAIMHHNDQTQRHDEKWAITINGLKGMGIKSQHAITRELEARAQQINAHHAKHQIDPTKHNLRHRGKRAINEVIRPE